MKFTEEYVMCMEKHVLDKLMFTNRLKMCLKYESERKRQPMEWKRTDSPVKWNIPGEALS